MPLGGGDPLLNDFVANIGDYTTCDVVWGGVRLCAKG